VIPTFVHSIITPVFNHATPILLRTHFGIDPVLTPIIYSVTSFLSQSLELFVRLPVETVLRRGQMSVVSSPMYLQSGSELQTVVDVGPYRGAVGTMWMIIREEGGSSDQELVRGTGGAAGFRKSKKGSARKGQGVEGLFRGWRVGMWGLVGMWGAAAMGGIGGNGGEF
jgi:fusion and transport protein UGO1